MADNTDPATRSRVMSHIKGRNTKPEMEIRKRLFAMGYRYRLHAKGLPGRPDIVFPCRRAVVFINGCFWHRHDCHLFKMPSTRRAWWKAKLDGNRKRDRANWDTLQSERWRVLVAWECAWRGRDQDSRMDDVASRIAGWLESDTAFCEIRS